MIELITPFVSCPLPLLAAADLNERRIKLLVVLPLRQARLRGAPVLANVFQCPAVGYGGLVVLPFGQRLSYLILQVSYLLSLSCPTCRPIWSCALWMAFLDRSFILWSDRENPSTKHRSAPPYRLSAKTPQAFDRTLVFG